MNLHRKPRAFTLIELLLVLVILSVLASVAIPMYMSRMQSSRRSATITEISHLKTAISTFEVDNGRFPRGEEGLSALLYAPQDVETTWHGPYLDKMPMDKWGHEYRYLYPAPEGLSPFNIQSSGEDGQEQTADDIDVYTVN